MTLYFIPARRLGISDEVLAKAIGSGFSRGPRAGHKYVKREFVGFKNGRIVYRYYYPDDMARSRGRRQVEGAPEEPAPLPREHHEHELLSNIHRLFKNLAKNRVKASEVTDESLSKALGIEGVDIKIHETFSKRHHGPFVQDERADATADVERFPLARVYRAFEMIPESMRDLLSDDQLKKIVITTRDDPDEIAMWKELGADPPAGWSSVDGELHLLADGPDKHGGGHGFTAAPGGRPRFGSKLTRSEEIAWHELAHQLHDSLIKQKSPIWDEWKKLSLGDSERISAYAFKSEKEDWAESVACMLSRPKQMARQCPARYDFFRKTGLIPGVSRETILKTPDEEQRWWDTKQQSKAAKIITHLRNTEGHPNYVGAYHSDKDQFYTVHYKGRALFFRLGPPDKESEMAGWSAVGDTIDPETELPVFDAATAARFRAGEAYKEIYDENGNALTPEQALLYLGQDDEDFLSKLPDDPSAFDKKTNYTLPFKLYVALGESRGSQDEERQRVKDARDKGKSAKLDRHEWVPMEMSKEEFEALTPTFKFHNLRAAEEQPFSLRSYDSKTKESRVVMTTDPVTGKERPVRTATVYEMHNPDGTKTKLTVNESDPFTPGQTMLVPLAVKKRYNGVETTEQEWVRYRIQPNGVLTPDEKKKDYRRTKSGKLRAVESDKTWPELAYTHLDPAKLARDLGTTTESLLQKNGRYEQGQLIDPMMAKLINPTSERIRNEGDLIRLMREAAKAQATTWVTVQSGSESSPSYAHVKLTFDGGGNPIIAGEYWNRHLGSEDQLRIDSLLNAKNQIALEPVKEIAPHKIPIEPGNLVHYRDPQSGRWVYGRLIETKEEKDDSGAKRTNYVIQSAKGQGTGLAKTARVAQGEVKQALSSVDPEDFRRVRRDVEPMKSHLLLYGDKLRFDSKGELRGGMVRLKAPSDGSIEEGELRRLPKVRMDDDGPYIDLRDLTMLREEFGGFVMDHHVQQLMDGVMKDQHRLAERSRRKDVVAPTQLTSDDGGVNTEELLKGLRATTPNGNRFKLGSHQEDYLRACARNGGRIMAAHFMGTGKTVSAIAAIQMMRNAKKEDGTPIDGSPRRRVAIVVPLNTVQQWESAVREYTEGAATVIGSSTLAGAVQAFHPDKWPKRGDNESDGDYHKRVAKAREKWTKENQGGWNPDTDKNGIVVIPFEYFRDNEADLRAHGGFDGLVVDEAHAIARENELSRAVERWNPSMNMLQLLTGTPITNRLDTIPRFADLLTNGKSPFGTKDEFTARYLNPSSVMLANGSKNPARTDINPQRAAELSSYLSGMIHVAQTDDVKGKTMPAVMLDENQPAHMTGMQEKVYRLAMATMTESEFAKLEEAGALGTDEAQAFSGAMKRKINIARSFANSPGYKPPDQREYVTYIEHVAKTDKKGQTTIDEVQRTFSLPKYERLTGKAPHGFEGKWPSQKSVEKGHISEGEYNMLSFYASQILGKDYEAHFAGKKVDAKTLAAIKSESVHGVKWGTIPNPEYGPEGALVRGRLDEHGEMKPLTAEFNGEHIEVPIGMRFIRDPNRKAAGVYYHQDDWDFSGGFKDDVEGGAEEGEEGAAEAEGEKTARVIGQRPKDPSLSIQTSPHRRRERAMFDVTMTHGNAKADELERYIRERTNTRTGGKANAQFILFGNRVGSSCRTMESKLRTMGYMDVNEALGHPDAGYSSEEDKKRRPKMGYFVTYFGKGATLGDRDINSEIFRKVKDHLGRDTETSMFVHRMMTGSVGKPPRVDPKTGKAPFMEGWSRAERKRIERLFASPSGEGGVEAPLRVTSKAENGVERPKYVYESDLSAAERAQVRELEIQRNGAAPEHKGQFDSKMNAIFEKHLTDRPPLAQHQIDVFDNCKHMVASDAAQVGLNWGNANELVMYDSLHSPMQEWQRITRAARMLDAVIPDKAKPVFAKLDEHIREHEKKSAMHEYKDMESALSIVHEAYDKLSDAEKNDATQMGFNPVVAAEAYFANRAFSKIAELRPQVKQRLRQTGRTLEPVERVDPNTGKVKVVARHIKPAEITNADVTNEILEKHLSPFEREILKSRKYLVNVKRLTTSVNMPVLRQVKVEDPDNPGKTKTIRVPTGEIVPEVPSKAELAQLTQGRAKQVPYEFFMKTVQDGLPITSEYDFLPVDGHSLAAMSQLPGAPRRERRPAQPPDAPAATPTSGTREAVASPAELRRRGMYERALARRSKLEEKLRVHREKVGVGKQKTKKSLVVFLGGE